MTETWKPVVGWELLYEVSDYGRVRKSSGEMLWHTGARQWVWLYGREPWQRRQVHHLVLEAFVGPRPPGMKGCHYDDDPSNNSLGNLRWDTTSANAFDSVRNGTHRNSSKTKCKAGHAFTPENTKFHKYGRACRTCIRRWKREARLRAKERAL